MEGTSFVEPQEPQPNFQHPVYLKTLRLASSQNVETAAIHESLLPKRNEQFQMVADKRFCIDEKDLNSDNRREGGFGIVFEGFDQNLKSPVAIKLIRPYLVNKVLTEGNDEYVEEFYDEVQKIAKLEHTNIARVYDIVSTEVDGLPTIGMSMEWLHDWNWKNIDMDEAIDVAKQIGSALDFIHDKGMAHNDVKPTNIMKRGDNTYVLTDFGSTRSLGATDIAVTPEFADEAFTSGKRDILSERMDQYALALSVCHMVGENNILLGKDPNLYLLPSKIPRNVREVLKRALDPLRENRYTSCAEFSNALGTAYAESLADPEPQETVIIDGITFKDIETLEDGPLKDIYLAMSKDIIDTWGNGNHIPWVTRHSAKHLPQGVSAEYAPLTRDNRLRVDTTQVPLVKPIIFDLGEYLGVDKDTDLPPEVRVQLQESLQDVTIAYNAQFEPFIEPSGDNSSTDIVYAGIIKSVVNGDIVEGRIEQAATLLPTSSQEQQVITRRGVKELLGLLRKKSNLDWKKLGEDLGQSEGEEKVDLLKSRLRHTPVEAARQAYMQGDPERATELLFTFIAQNPQLKIEPKMLDNGIVDHSLNMNKEYNGGVIRTKEQLPFLLARTVCYDALSNAREVYTLLKQITASDKLAFLLLDQQDTASVYRELSHELNTWLVSGFWNQNKGGNWKEYNVDYYYAEEEGQYKQINTLLDEYYAPLN